MVGSPAMLMFMLAFHGFLRIGEITVRPGVVAEHVIKRSDLVIVPARDRCADPIYGQVEIGCFPAIYESL